MKETAIHTALDATSIFMQDEDERLAYLNREMAIMDYQSDKESWTEEGRREGVLDMVKSMIANGLDTETIERISSWPTKEIEKIRNQRILHRGQKIELDDGTSKIFLSIKIAHISLCQLNHKIHQSILF